MKLSSAERSRLVRKERVSAGLCIDCNQPNPSLPRTRCDACHQKMMEYSKKHRTEKRGTTLCKVCGKPVDSHAIRLCTMAFKKKHTWNRAAMAYGLDDPFQNS